jgi:hypothetical protein
MVTGVTMNKPNGSARGSLASFVRSLPTDMSADDVVKEARKAKVPIKDRRRVWQIRSADNLKAKRQGKTSPSNGHVAPISQPAAVDVRSEVFQQDNLAREFLQIVAQIGLHRANALLSQFSEQVFRNLEPKP